MTKVLSSLRLHDSIQILSNALNIYLNDPVADWLNSEKERADIDYLRSDTSWRPRRRIESTIKKLSGHSPIAVLLEDLKDNPKVRDNKSLNALSNILHECVSRRKKDSIADTYDVGEQIDILMVMSSHPNILVRQWNGLQTWI